MEIRTHKHVAGGAAMRNGELVQGVEALFDRFNEGGDDQDAEVTEMIEFFGVDEDTTMALKQMSKSQAVACITGIAMGWILRGEAELGRRK